MSMVTSVRVEGRCPPRERTTVGGNSSRRIGAESDQGGGGDGDDGVESCVAVDGMPGCWGSEKGF